MSIHAMDRLISALDVPSRAQAEALVSQLGDAVNFYKIGYQLVYSDQGLALAKDLKAEGKKVFLDVKLHDIPNTIEKGVGAIAKMGLDMVTVHAYPQTMAAAVKAAKGSSLCVLGVTVMTSMDDGDLHDAGYGFKAQELVIKRAQNAAQLGMGGLVASAHEATQIRAAIGDELAIVTPGIRPQGTNDLGDQKRVMTPSLAIGAGASHLVVGRPIYDADDPLSAALEIQEQIANAI